MSCESSPYHESTVVGHSNSTAQHSLERPVRQPDETPACTTQIAVESESEIKLDAVISLSSTT